MPRDEKPITETTDDARAGVIGHHVRGVLVASLVGAILLMIVIAAVSFH